MQFLHKHEHIHLYILVICSWSVQHYLRVDFNYALDFFSLENAKDFSMFHVYHFFTSLDIVLSNIHSLSYWDEIYVNFTKSWDPIPYL